MTLKFQGFGLNWQTLLLAFVMATLVSGAFTLVRPIVGPKDPSASEDVALGATYPCRPYAARERTVTNSHGAVGWTIYIKARIRYNGCDVYVIAGTQDCYWWSLGYSVEQRACSNYRLNVNTAYGERVVIWGRFQVYVGWQGFPVSVSTFMCQSYGGGGQLAYQRNGPFYSEC